MRFVSLGPPPARSRILAFSIDVALVGGATLVAGLVGGRWFALAVAIAGLPVASAIFLAIAGTTPGKRATGLRVVGVDGQRPPLRAILRRELWGRLFLEHGLLFAGGAGAVGYGAGFTGPRRPWHDTVAGTHVVARTSVATARPLAPPYAPVERIGPGGLELAPLLPRLAAYLIDFGLVLTVWSLLFLPLAIFTGQIDTDGDDQQVSGAFGFSAIATAVLLAGLYAAVALYLRETTVGKHAVGLAVRRVDGSRISLGRALAARGRRAPAAVRRGRRVHRRAAAAARPAVPALGREGAVAARQDRGHHRRPGGGPPPARVLTPRPRGPTLTPDERPRFRMVVVLRRVRCRPPSAAPDVPSGLPTWRLFYCPRIPWIDP